MIKWTRILAFYDPRVPGPLNPAFGVVSKKLHYDFSYFYCPLHIFNKPLPGNRGDVINELPLIACF